MNHERWTMYEKKRLIRLLNKYSVDDYEGIARKLPHKSADDVAMMITTQLKRVKYKEQQWIEEEKAKEKNKADEMPALDKWIKITAGLVDKETLDFSTHLARVMGIIAEFETFPDPDRATFTPDYRAIYRYLQALLAGRESPQLRPTESAVVLEILQSLLEVLAGADTDVQRHIMRWKYQLITAPKSGSSQKTKYNRKVVENDFTDFIRNQGETEEVSDSDTDTNLVDEAKVAGATKGGRGKQKKATHFSPYICTTSTNSGVALETSVSQAISEKDRKATIRKNKARDDQFLVINEGLKGSYVQIKPDPADLTDKKQLDELQKNMTVVKRKEYTYRPEPKEPEVVLVMPPVNKPIVQINIPQRSNKGTKDGKYKSLGKVNSDICIQKVLENKASKGETSKESLKQMGNTEHSKQLNNMEILKKLNAKIRKEDAKYTLKDLETDYNYIGPTARKDSRVNIAVKLPVNNTDNNVQVEFPAADIQHSGNIHVKLSAAKFKGGMGLEIPMKNIVSTNMSSTEEARTKTTAARKTVTVNMPRQIGNVQVPSSGKTTEPTTVTADTVHVPEHRLPVAPPLPIISSVQSLRTGSSEVTRNESQNSAWSDLVAIPTGLIASEALHWGSESRSSKPVPVPITPETSLTQHSEPAIPVQPEDSSVPVLRPDSVSSLSTVSNTQVMSTISPLTVEPSGPNTLAVPNIRPSSSVLSGPECVTSVMPAEGPDTAVTSTPLSVLEPYSPFAAESCTRSDGIAASSSSVAPTEITGVTLDQFKIFFTKPHLSTSTGEVEKSKEKHKKRKAFDKSRYTAFVKSDEATKTTEKMPKKPKLYSLNPFCVPISLLDIAK